MNVSLEIDPELVQYLSAIAHDDAMCAEFPLALHVRQRLKARAELRWVQAVARREGLPPLPRLTTRCSTPLRRGRGARVAPPPWARTMAGRGATHRVRATRLYAHSSRADDDQQAGCSMLRGKRCQRSACTTRSGAAGRPRPTTARTGTSITTIYQLRRGGREHDAREG